MVRFQKLHQLEINSLVKMSELAEVAGRPKPIERQKVATVLQVFCDEMINDNNIDLRIISLHRILKL